MLLRLLAAAAVSLAALPAAAVERPSQLIVFGDSLVDTGNLDAALGSDAFNPRALGYFPGQFSNGPNYTTLLSRYLYGAPSRPSLTGGTNYAFGGARVVSNAGYASGGDAIPDLALQVATYGFQNGGAADPNALYVINMGGNDVFAVGSGTINGVDPTTYLTNVASTIAASVATLQAQGARRFLVAGIPNPSATGFAADVLLTSALNALPLDSDTSLLRFDYQGLYVALTANPEAFGVAPLTETGNCIGNRPVTASGTDCTGYFSFDGTHPTAQIQAAVYRQVLDLTGLNAVPEPGTWALMIAGFGLVGVSLRRRRVSTTV